MAITLSVNGTQLPSCTDLKRSDEMLWSDGTGRGATDGMLVGSVVATKRTFTAKWGILTQAQYDAVRGIPTGFFTLSVRDGAATLATMTAYRSNVEAEAVGTFGGKTYWKDASVQFTER